MTAIATRSAPRAGADALRRTALVTGVLFLITYLTSISAKFAFYPPFFEADYILGAGGDGQLAWGALVEVILIVANIGTAVVLYPVLRRQNETLALGFVTARVMESVFIAVGILAVLTTVTLRQDVAFTGADDGALSVVGSALAEMQEWTFILGPGFVVGVGNGLLLGYLMYRSGLVPRGMAWLGLVGGSLICVAGAAMVLGVIELGSTWQVLATVPEFFWELSLGVYLIVKGFKPSPVTADMAIVR